MMRAFILLTSRMSGGLKGTTFLFPGPTAGPGDLIISDVQLPACVGFRIPVALPHYPSPHPPTPPRFFPSELLQSKPSLQQGPGVHAHSILLISRLLSVYERNSRPFPVNGCPWPRHKLCNHPAHPKVPSVSFDQRLAWDKTKH
ncbi:hypothetical protein ASPFODRAFT_709297 [Aspergillus luchuensis CBS 106.47]|uniref:Uncharacterized protein n=1 Tax=Aspergillus luchuensis (strain CBS 106.47) TaxID=1137211 RepID=A0A1M3TQ82_ASPLC|nr:hypothetical protein ASPFODRAFT_709297 [Aspergillus luchuensis CBS 106.47]